MTLKKYFVNFTKIIEIDAEQCDGKFWEHFPQFLTKAVFLSNPSIGRIPLKINTKKNLAFQMNFYGIGDFLIIKFLPFVEAGKSLSYHNEKVSALREGDFSSPLKR